jgi:hypothetical protein
MFPSRGFACVVLYGFSRELDEAVARKEPDVPLDYAAGNVAQAFKQQKQKTGMVVARNAG